MSTATHPALAQPQHDPQQFLLDLYRIAVQRAQPLHSMAQHLPKPPKGRTVVLGAGKAGGSMAQALEALWPQDAPLSGLVVTRYDHIPPRPEGLARRLEVVEAAHPVPDAAGLAAAERILALTEGLTEDDLVLCLISGGGSSLLTLPTVIAQFSGPDPADWVQWTQNHLASPTAPLHITLYILLIVFFAYFYTAITFNPDQVADDMKKYGGFIPGIRAGRPTAEYLDYVLTRVTLPGSIYLGIIALIPLVAFALLGASQNFMFGGTSILIIVGVGLETVKQIDSQLQQRHYEGLLR